jgi:hypothetical protein
MNMRPDEVLDHTADRLAFYGRSSPGSHDAAGHNSLEVTMAAVEAEGTDYQDYLRAAPAAVQALVHYLADHPEVTDPGSVSNDTMPGSFQAEVVRAASTGTVLGAILTAWNDRTPDDDLVIDTLRRCADGLRRASGRTTQAAPDGQRLRPPSGAPLPSTADAGASGNG